MNYFEELRRDRKLTPAILAAALSACATESVLLNSERIEQQFDSYGVDVLASEKGFRRSSLYSLEGEERICRTYAVVRFTDEPDTSYGLEHAQVLAGNSLGEVFKSHDWAIHKQTLYMGSFELESSNGEMADLMQLDGRTDIALHVYQLLLAKNENVFEYATIIEAHHPRYLTQTDLLEIYHYDEKDALSAESVTDVVRILAAP